MVSVKSRAHRTLRSFENFTFDMEECEKFLSEVDIGLYEHKEDLVGVYFNEPSQPYFSIGVFERGLLFWDGNSKVGSHFKFVNFKNIEDHKAPEYKHTASYIKLILENGEIAILPILGGKGKFRDVFEFQRFLMRVLEDLQPPQSGASE